MQESKPSKGFSLPPNIPRGRRRQQRTVYSVEQREELERFFQNNHYPSYDERETLAARLNLQEHQVQVWFKNRRAKQTRLQRGTATRQRGPKARASSRGPQVCAPAPAAAAAGPGFAQDPVLPSGPGSAEDPEFPWDLWFPEDLLSPGGSVPPGDEGFDNPFGGGAAAETSAPSHVQPWRDPAQDVQNTAPAAPASAPATVPVWPEDSNADNFLTDFDLVELLSL